MADYGKVETHEDFANYVRDLLGDLEKGESYWQNGSLKTFLESLAHWVKERMPDYWEREGRQMPDAPAWKLMAELLFVGAVYE